MLFCFYARRLQAGLLASGYLRLLSYSSAFPGLCPSGMLTFVPGHSGGPAPESDFATLTGFPIKHNAPDGLCYRIDEEKKSRKGDGHNNRNCFIIFRLLRIFRFNLDIFHSSAYYLVMHRYHWRFL